MTLQRKKIFQKSLAVLLCSVCLVGILSEHSYVTATESTTVDSAYATMDDHAWDNTFGFQANGNATELTYLYQNSDTGIRDYGEDGVPDCRFADSKETWVYYFKFDDKLSSLVLDLVVEGQRLVDVSCDGVDWTNVVVDWDKAEKENMRINLSDIVIDEDELYIRFGDSSQWEDHGTGLWSLHMHFNLQNGEKDIVPSGPEGTLVEQTFSMNTAGSEQEQRYLFEDYNSHTINGDCRFADKDAYWIYCFRFSQSLDKAILALDIAGQYKVSVSVDGVNWVTVAESSSFAERSTFEIDLKRAEYSMMYDGNQLLYLKFSDADTTDGYGPALYSVGFKYTVPLGATEIGVTAPTTNRFGFDMSTQTTLQKTADTMYMFDDQSTGSGVNTEEEYSYRFADEDAYWIYSFSFFDELWSAKVSLYIANQYEISVSENGVDWQVVATSTELSGYSWIEVDLSTFLYDKDVTHLYLKFADSVATNGFGVSFREIQLDYMLKNGLPDTAPMPITSTLYAPIETWNGSASISVEGTMDNYYLSETECGAFSLECDIDMSANANLSETMAASIAFGMDEAGAEGYSFAVQRNYDGTTAVRLFKVPHRDQNEEGDAVDEIYYRNDVDELYTSLLNNVDISVKHKLKVTRHMGKIELFLDGTLLKTVYDNEFTSGHIGFGVFNGSAEFVNIRVQDSTGIGVSISGDQQIGLGKETSVDSAITNNNTVEDSSIIWTVSGENAPFAYIDSNGVFKATKSGYYDVTASLDTVRSVKLRIAVGLWVEGVAFDKIYYGPTTVSFISKGSPTLNTATFSEGDTVSATGEYGLNVTHEDEERENYLNVNFWVVIYGDVTGDGLINNSDCIGLLEHLVGSSTLTNAAWLAADMSSNTEDKVEYVDDFTAIDGALDVRDLVAIAKTIQ